MVDIISARSTSEDAMWQAVMSRDADAVFFYAVKTTGVYCRPSCSARRPRRRNVEFYETEQDAERAGFRACKRCGALRGRREVAVETMCRRLEAGDAWGDIAARVGWSAGHARRVFKDALGMTPKVYAAGHKGERVREALVARDTVTEAIYEAGFSSSGRFYEASPRALGMTPTAYRRKGAGQDIRFAVGECWLGSVLVGATPSGVCAVLLGDDPDALIRDLEARFSRATLIGADKNFDAQVAQVIGVIEGTLAASTLSLDVQGTAFQRRVWRALSEIPRGQTATYREVAEAIGKPTAARAVARACATNPVAVAVPCHRVVRADGGLSGYRWGVERKRALIAHERIPIDP